MAGLCPSCHDDPAAAPVLRMCAWADGCRRRIAQAVDERQAAELEAAAAAVGFLAAAQEWSARLDRFCADLERQGLDVKRDGWKVTIDIRPRPPQ